MWETSQIHLYPMKLIKTIFTVTNTEVYLTLDTAPQQFPIEWKCIISTVENITWGLFV